MYMYIICTLQIDLLHGHCLATEKLLLIISDTQYRCVAHAYIHSDSNSCNHTDIIILMSYLNLCAAACPVVVI